MENKIDVAIRDEAVPIVITHRTVKKPPQVIRKRKFVGIKAGLKSLLVKAIELVEESFWREDREVKDVGDSTVSHFAIDICDEDDGLDERSFLRVTKLPGDTRPACGAHFEVIKIAEEPKPFDGDGVVRLPVEEGKPKFVAERQVHKAPRLLGNRNQESSN